MILSDNELHQDRGRPVLRVVAVVVRNSCQTCPLRMKTAGGWARLFFISRATSQQRGLVLGKGQKQRQQ